MKFRWKKEQFNRVVLVISDLHLGAGPVVKGRRNLLEDFYFDKEFVEFLAYYGSEFFKNAPVELVINGDFLDFLSVPYVEYFDDEFWSERASLQKLDLIVQGHREVFEGLDQFLSGQDKRLVYIIGNHDGEMILPQVQEHFKQIFSPDHRDRIEIIHDCPYFPWPSVKIQHGHHFELPHIYSSNNIVSHQGEKHFLPPWGSYYILRVVNKFKEDRKYISSIRPIKTFILYGLLFDTFQTIRFIFANVYYLIMVMVVNYFQDHKRCRSPLDFINYILNELRVFQDYSHFTREEFVKDPQIKILVLGHTHIPRYLSHPDGTIFINTGSWVKMFNLDFSQKQDGKRLSYAILMQKNGVAQPVESALYVWKGSAHLPYEYFY